MHTKPSGSLGRKIKQADHAMFPASPVKHVQVTVTVKRHNSYYHRCASEGPVLVAGSDSFLACACTDTQTQCMHPEVSSS